MEEKGERKREGEGRMREKGEREGREREIGREKERQREREKERERERKREEKISPSRYFSILSPLTRGSRKEIQSEESLRRVHKKVTQEISKPRRRNSSPSSSSLIFNFFG